MLAMRRQSALLVLLTGLWLTACSGREKETPPPTLKAPTGEGSVSFPAEDSLGLEQAMLSRFDALISILVETLTRGNWDKAAMAARYIADAPHPLEAVERALGGTPSRLQEFRGLDRQARARARELSEALTGREVEKSLDALGDLIHTCVRCHQTFRDPGAGVKPR